MSCLPGSQLEAHWTLRHQPTAQVLGESFSLARHVHEHVKLRLEAIQRANQSIQGLIVLKVVQPATTNPTKNHTQLMMNRFT